MASYTNKSNVNIEHNHAKIEIRFPSRIFFNSLARSNKISVAKPTSRIIFKPIGWLKFDKNTAIHPVKLEF